MYNCTIARNDTAMATCCPPGNSTASTDDRLSICLVADEGQFGKCLGDMGVTGQRCQGPIGVESSGASGSRPVGSLPVLLLAALVLPAAVGALA